MSQICVVYSGQDDQLLKYPASAQHPDAVRYVVGGRVVDAIGGAPTQAEVVAFLSPPPPSADELEQQALAALNGGGPQADMRKLIKAVVINFTARALGLPPGQLTALQLQTERARIAAIYKNL